MWFTRIIYQHINSNIAHIVLVLKQIRWNGQSDKNKCHLIGKANIVSLCKFDMITGKTPFLSLISDFELKLIRWPCK